MTMKYQTTKSYLMFLLMFLCLIAADAMAQHNMGKGSAKEIYNQYCAGCHGANLQGGTGGSLIDDHWLHGGNDEDITRIIKQGVPTAGMPGWAHALTDEQVRSLVILIREERKLADLASIAAKTAPKEGVFVSTKYGFTLEKVAEGTGTFWSLDFMPDGSLLVPRQDGQLWRFKGGQRFGPISGTPEVLFQAQGGLLAVQLHPDYATNGWIYLSYSQASANGSMTAVVRGRIKNNTWIDQEVLFQVAPELHLPAHHHYGTRFVFKDGYLYFSIGDRGEDKMAQDLQRPNGKIHRIHDDGRIPADNPFVQHADAYKTVWSYGHRNPQGLAIHPVTGELWATEHGPRGGDEVNRITKGLNYGWPVITHGMNYDGTPITEKTRQEGMEQPRHYWTPSIAPGGIEFYRGHKFPEWQHDLFVGGMGSTELHRLKIVDDNIIEDEIVLSGQGRIRDIRTGPDGYLYLVTNIQTPLSSVVYRLIPTHSPTWLSKNSPSVVPTAP